MTGVIIQNAILDYMEKYGQEESKTIMERVMTSNLFNENVEIACKKRGVFSADIINKIVASSHWKFALGNKRKIYFGSLLFLSAVYSKIEHLGLPLDDEKFAETLIDIKTNFEKMM